MERTLMQDKVKKPISKKRISDLCFVAGIMIYPMILFIVFYVYVNLNSFILAFTESDLYGNTTFVGMQNFKEFISALLEDGTEVSNALINSLKTWAINLVICVPLYLTFSYLVFKKCFFHRGIRMIVMLPGVISGFVVGMLFVAFISGTSSPMTTLFEKLGVLDSQGSGLQLLYSNGYKYAFGTIIFYGIWVSFGTNLIVYPNAMNAIAPEIYESAQLDGVRTMWQEMRYIILPLIYPTLTTFVVTGLAGMFTDVGYVLAFYPQGVPYGANVINMGYYYFTKVQGGTGDFSVMSAGGLILTALIAPITILVRFLMEKYGPTTEGY